MKAAFAYLISVFGCYLLYKAAQETPINPLTIGAIMPMVLTGPAASGDALIRRLQAAGKALITDPDDPGDRAPTGVPSPTEPQPENGS